MANQYTKVQLQIKIEKPEDISALQQQFTKAYFSIIKKHIPKNKIFIEEVINRMPQGCAVKNRVPLG